MFSLCYSQKVILIYQQLMTPVITCSVFLSLEYLLLLKAFEKLQTGSIFATDQYLLSKQIDQISKYREIQRQFNQARV